MVTICAADPLNLTGVIVPGPRVPAVRTKQVTYIDGLPAPVSPIEIDEPTHPGGDAAPDAQHTVLAPALPPNPSA
jgi:ATP-dependent Lhr-like helicase